MQAQLVGDRRADLLRVEGFTLDRRGLDHFGRQRPQIRLRANLEPECLQFPNELALLVTHPGQVRRQRTVVPAQIGPARPLMDERHFSPQVLR